MAFHVVSGDGNHIGKATFHNPPGLYIYLSILICPKCMSIRSVQRRPSEETLPSKTNVPHETPKDCNPFKGELHVFHFSLRRVSLRNKDSLRWCR